MSDEKLQQAMETIAAQSETIAETTQAFTDLTRMTLNLAMGVRAATPSEELLSFMVEVMKGALIYSMDERDEKAILLCKDALAWLELFKKDDES